MIRRVLFWTHRLAGLAAVAYVVVIALSGAALVFREELRGWEHPQTRLGGEPGSPDDALAVARQQFPGWQPLSITFPNTRSPQWMVYLLRGREAREVYFLAGRLTTAVDPRAGVSGALAGLHSNLLAGRTGRRLNGYGAAVLLWLALSGGYLWLPRSWTADQLRARLRIGPGGGPRVLAWQLHHSLGVGTFLFAAILALTGMYYVWSAPYLNVARQLGRSTEPRPAAHSPEAALLSIAELARRAEAVFPGRPVHRVSVPAGPHEAVRATLREGEPQEFHWVSTVFLDPVTGAVLGTNPLESRPRGDAFLGWLSALHFGVFGGWPVRWLWCALGLALAAVAVTGPLLWWLRRKVEQKLP
jgi:uncharacterized iron-regulated membrane protein